MKNEMNFRRTAYIHLRGGLERLRKKSQTNNANIEELDKDISKVYKKNGNR